MDMPFLRMLVVLSAAFLSGCATGGFDWVGGYYPVNDIDRAKYAARPKEKFPLEAVDLTKLDPRYRRQVVRYPTSEAPGTIVVDTPNRYLYLVTGEGRAIRYGIEVGREGLAWNGAATVARKAKWPTWTPPAEMIKRDPRTAPYASGMPGGPENPLGSRALYLYQNGRDTLYRIHGGGKPTTLGKATSSGCIRLLDHDVIDLFERVPNGTRTVVMPDPLLSRAPDSRDEGPA
jgi:lipoprotein-anchoring transpeptidase ErfK/SrfK